MEEKGAKLIKGFLEAWAGSPMACPLAVTVVRRDVLCLSFWDKVVATRICAPGLAVFASAAQHSDQCGPKIATQPSSTHSRDSFLRVQRPCGGNFKSFHFPHSLSGRKLLQSPHVPVWEEENSWHQNM